MQKYIVKDSLGNFIKSFITYKEASEYKFTFGNYNWEIKEIIVK